LKKLILGKKSRIFNKRIYEITNGEEFKKDFDFRQIRRHQFQFHQILQKDLKENTDKRIYIFFYVANIFCRSITIVFSIGFKLYYKIEFDELFENVSDISKLISGFIKYLNDSQRSEVEMYSTLRHLTLRR
jgi:hypothetical protein